VAFTYSILVVAHRTADSDELLEALKAHAARRPTRFTLLVPAQAGGPQPRAAASEALERALERLREAGLEVDGRVGHHDPIDAVSDAWDPREFDEVIVSTLPGAASRWLQWDVPHRIARLTGVQVTHVLASDKREVPSTPVPEREKQGLLSPLSVLTWGGASQER
jgi:Asp-tRNA(Asn)/Glu-tRNA(Gln) amidotransferase A subunit family amidase